MFFGRKYLGGSVLEGGWGEVVFGVWGNLENVEVWGRRRYFSQFTTSNSPSQLLYPHISPVLDVFRVLHTCLTKIDICVAINTHPCCLCCD